MIYTICYPLQKMDRPLMQKKKKKKENNNNNIMAELASVGVTPQRIMGNNGEKNIATLASPQPCPAHFPIMELRLLSTVGSQFQHTAPVLKFCQENCCSHYCICSTELPKRDFGEGNHGEKAHVSLCTNNPYPSQHVWQDIL